MKILKEAKKEQIPVSFLTDLVSRGWSEIGTLKETVKCISAEYKDTTKVEKIMQDLIDAYLICVGQLELFMEKKDYATIPENSKNESLKESVEELENVVADLLIDEKEAVDGYNKAIDKLDDIKDIEVLRHIEDEELEHIEELSELVGKTKTGVKVESEPIDDFNCDFDEPVGPKPTDADIYSAK